MSNQYLSIEQFSQLSGLSVNTVRRKIKTLSETDKNAYISYIPVVGRGGQKIMLDKALITQWTAMSNQETAQNPVDESMSNQEKETLTDKKDDTSGQTKEPEHDKIKNGSSERDDSSIVEILRGQIEYLQKQGEVKDSQINDLSHTNKELLERLKEVNYTLATAQKQLSAPQEQTPGELPKWWQFWK